MIYSKTLQNLIKYALNILKSVDISKRTCIESDFSYLLSEQVLCWLIPSRFYTMTYHYTIIDSAT